METLPSHGKHFFNFIPWRPRRWSPLRDPREEKPNSYSLGSKLWPWEWLKNFDATNFRVIRPRRSACNHTARAATTIDSMCDTSCLRTACSASPCGSVGKCDNFPMTQNICRLNIQPRLNCRSWGGTQQSEIWFNHHFAAWNDRTTPDDLHFSLQLS